MTNHPPPAREFLVTTNFQIEALKPGGLPLSVALERAERNLASFRDRFADVLAGQIAGIESVADCARAGDPTWREQLTLRCSDLSDAATTLGYRLVGSIATQLRETCDTPEATTQHQAIIMRHIEAMRRYGAAEFRESPPSNEPEIEVGSAPPKSV